MDFFFSLIVVVVVVVVVVGKRKEFHMISMGWFSFRVALSPAVHRWRAGEAPLMMPSPAVSCHSPALARSLRGFFYWSFVDGRVVVICIRVGCQRVIDHPMKRAVRKWRRRLRVSFMAAFWADRWEAHEWVDWRPSAADSCGLPWMSAVRTPME